MIEKPDGRFLEIALERAWATEQKRQPVTTELLGRAAMTGLAFENAGGSPLRVSRDYFGHQRSRWKADAQGLAVGPAPTA